METTTKRSIWPFAIGVIVLGGLAALGWQTLSGTRINAASPTTVVAGTAIRVPPSAIDTQNAFVTVAKGVRPAIVSITSRMTIRSGSMSGTDFGPSSGSDFDFGGSEGPGIPGLRGLPDLPDMGQIRPMPRIAQGTSSGFIVRSDGWIMTNDHVVADADRVTVRLDDGRDFVGQVRRDFRSDLAMVKIPANNLPTLGLSDSSHIDVGQWAIAFGSPFGLRDTMTVGVVSAIGRESTIGESRDDARYYPSLIQTDASINPGNSGGPLMDIYGNVMGVNVAIGSPTGGNVGIGFAIPANTAKFVMDQLITKGTVTRGFLGLVPQDLSPTDQQRYGVKEGALVTAVTENSPAAQAGLQVEDVITRFNGQPIQNEVELRDSVSRATPGQSVPITIVRGGKQQSVNATIEPAAADRTAQASPAAPQRRIGIQVADMTADLASQLGMDPSTIGVVVVGVQPASPAMEAGIRPGDMLLRINGKDLTSADQATESIKALKSGETASIITRRDKTRLLNRVEIP